MGNVKSSLQDCIELDESMLSIRTDSPAGYNPKFVFIRRTLYLLVDEELTRSGKFIISLRELESEGLLDYKFVNGTGQNAPIVIKQIKNSSKYVLNFHPSMKEGVHKFTIRFDKKRICRVYIYCERAKEDAGDAAPTVPAPSTAPAGSPTPAPAPNTRNPAGMTAVSAVVSAAAPATAPATVHTTPPSPPPPPPGLHDPVPNFIQDGPQFRTQLANWESILFLFRSHLKSLYERSTKLKELLQMTSKEFNLLSNDFNELHCILKDQPVSSVFRHLLLSSSSVCVSQARLMMKKATASQEDLASAIQQYLNTIDLKAVSSSKKQYHDQAKDFYSYVGKNLSQKSDSKLLPRRIQFELQRFDYFHSLLQYVVGCNARDFAVSLARFQSSIDPNNKNTNMHLVKKYRSHFLPFNKIKSQQRIRLSKVSNYSDLNDFYQLASATSEPNKPLKEGLLWSYRNNGWHKQWVVLQGSQLSEYSDWKTKAKVLSRPAINLTFVCVKRSEKKPNGFDIITTDGEARSFQAESEDEMKQWLYALHSAVGIIAIEETDENKDPLSIVRNADPSNSACCDCRSDKQVEWISLNILCVVCINCSGVHRSLGAHVSKMRSLTLDSFSSPESLQLLKCVSNQNVNSLYESEDLPPIFPENSIDQRKSYITDKYVSKKYVNRTEDISKLHISLIKAIHLESIYLLQKCFAEGVSLCEDYWLQNDGNDSLFQYSLKHWEGTKENPVFTVTEFLVLNGLHVDDLPTSHEHRALWSPGQLSYWSSKYKNHNCLHNRVGAKKLPEVPTSAAISLHTRNPRHTTDFTDSICSPDIPSSAEGSSKNDGQSAPGPATTRSRRWSVGMGQHMAGTTSHHFTSPILGKSRHLKFPKIQK
ncbi:AFR725Cp [Eremothecium gossypii ATCC 10895]|uniref:ADP-ribosylation factor GTPase-activating protein n=1 Tax=Eremothecium gossypii (strain ATCC 10895 / CBS 109.51 / FGSC 9923 / NRRL Y-1056) TaxID=284811 RepID=Q751V0_EREGS|nr:AFR725Cp [Eremothecium gossypii ATCC 10895]AAS54097.1 AFR725Cp [Eremothecium gossypii ATCC 10895]AEY98412.1 FAFR725Cp [Eremothecium gossypii FDAG1]